MDIRFKWKNLRDAFVRYRRQLINFKKRNSGKDVKTYIYAKQMHFLTKNIDPKLMTNSSLRGPVKRTAESGPRSPAFEQVFMPGDPGSCTSEDTMEVEEKLIENDGDDNNTLPPKIDSSRSQTVNETDRTEQCESDEYYDMAFFKSLQPMLRRLSPDQKMLFRIDVMKLLANYAGANTASTNFTSSARQDSSASYSQSDSITDIKCAFRHDVFPSSSDDL